MKRGLAYIGQVAKITPIEGAEKVELATVVCGTGGMWKGVVPKEQYQENDRCIVYLPDAIVPQTEELAFMEKHKWRVSMRRFLGVPSEVLIMPDGQGNIGDDVTDLLGVKKHEKPIPANMAGEIYGDFPSFIPRTDEPNFQSVPHILEAMKGKSYIATLKADGTSCTVYKYTEHFGVCSRNWELLPGDSIYWKMAEKYRLDSVISNGYAIQFEIVGPGIQKNPMGLKENEIRIFDIYDIENRKYLNQEFLHMACSMNGYPDATIILEGREFNFTEDQLRELSEVTYGDKPGEGIVVRTAQESDYQGERLSFKVINLLYKG